MNREDLARALPATLVLGLAASCGSLAGKAGSTASLPGAGGNGGALASSTSSTTTIPLPTTSGGGGGAGGTGGAAWACNPAAAPGSFYELSAPAFGGGAEALSMCHFRGDVVLVVNTAAL